MVAADKLPPFDVEAEEAVIASVLVDEDAIARVENIVQPEHFFRDQNRWAFEACLALWSRGEAINQVTSLRGRLGAFQRTSLETNRNALNDTLVNLTEAESLVRDADFAEETAALTRAQILVQSGTVVLQIANQNPQNVLSLLRG